MTEDDAGNLVATTFSLRCRQFCLEARPHPLGDKAGEVMDHIERLYYVSR